MVKPRFAANIKKKGKEMKRISLIVAMAIVLLVVLLTVVLSGCYDSTKKEGDLQKRTSLTVRDDGTFVILQLTDLHLTGNGSYNKDRQTLRWVEEALDEVKPDLVEVTGDAMGGAPPARDKALLALANIFEERQVYWAYTFGNHDGEHVEGADGGDGHLRHLRGLPLLQVCRKGQQVNKKRGQGRDIRPFLYFLRKVAALFRRFRAREKGSRFRRVFAKKALPRGADIYADMAKARRL